MSQAGIVDAHIHPFVKRFDGREHGQDLLFVGQVTFVRDECAAEARALTFGCQFLKHTRFEFRLSSVIEDKKTKDRGKS